MWAGIKTRKATGELCFVPIVIPVMTGIGRGYILSAALNNKIAESQFRRAAWLNPFEYRFVLHLAWCLYKQGYYKKAKEYVKKVDDKYAQMNEDGKMIIERIKQKVE
ncbi:MAG TPA: hypothetical protein ENH43_00735 [Phycisphaerales bacterium]|nr:hypothetical protein [Phycisphaerales bacterium]